MHVCDDGWGGGCGHVRGCANVDAHGSVHGNGCGGGRDGGRGGDGGQLWPSVGHWTPALSCSLSKVHFHHPVGHDV